MPVKPIPDGYHTVTPYLMVKDAPRFLAFMADVFGAQTRLQLVRPDGNIGHTEITVGDSVIMLCEAMPEGPTPCMLHFYVDDVDATFDKAVKAGGTVIAPPTLQFYGDRSGGVKEPTGYSIWIATHVEDVPPDELERRGIAAMQARA